MKKLTIALAVAMLSMTALGQKVNFSGEWSLNSEKSQLAEQFSMAPGQVEINMDDNAMTEVRQLSFQGENFTTTDKYTLDGKECQNPGWMDMIKKSKASYSEDGKKLTIVTLIPMQEEEMKITTEYSMKGENLVINSTASSSFGEMSELQVFDKK